MNPREIEQALSAFPRTPMGHLPTPLEPMPNLGRALGLDLHVKRDDCTGIGLGGNKIRQLAYYFGAALAQGADVVLITGAVQSNFVRATAAMAARLGMACHIQLEERVPNVSDLHRSNGNVLLSRLMGATLHSYPEGEDEAGADRALHQIADGLRANGHSPFVIPLGADSKPLGALGYVAAAVELCDQLAKTEATPTTLVVASGSALTHAGLLLGLRLLGSDIKVIGVCVRRAAGPQAARVAQRVEDTARLMGLASPVTPTDIHLTDTALAPGYGQLNPATRAAIQTTAQTEGLFLDPVYTGKTMAGVTHLAQANALTGQRVIFWHTGGQPALFGYADDLV